MATFRNPFDRWNVGIPQPKTFAMPNQTPSTNNSIFGGGREHQLFRDYEPPEPRAQPETRSSSWGSYLDELKSIYTQEGPATAAYREHLGSMPEFQKPSGWQKFGSALVGAAEGFRSGGAAGWQAGQEALMSPYRKAMEQWGSKEAGLGRQAEIEDRAANRKLDFMKEVRAVAKDDQEAQRWIDEYNLKVDKEENDRIFQEAQMDKWRTEGYVKDYDDKGNIIFVNPKTGDIRKFGPSSKIRDWGFEERRTRTGERNAATGEANVGWRAKEYGLRERDTNRLERREDRYENPVISPQDQSAARNSALARAASESATWSQFLDAEGNLNPDTTFSNPDEYKRFMDRVQQIEDDMFNRRRALGRGGRGGGSGTPEIIY